MNDRRKRTYEVLKKFDQNLAQSIISNQASKVERND